MQKRDFIQNAVPQLLALTKDEETGKFDADKAIAWAEKLWAKLSEKGYGDTKKQGPRDIPAAYDELEKHPVMLAAFNLFWTAFGKHGNRDGAAMRWLQMGELSKQDYDLIIQAAKREADARKALPEGRTGIYAQGWLNGRRWLDKAETTMDQAQKQQHQKQQQLRKLNQDLAHAKKMADDTGDPYWYGEAEKLTEQLRQLRQHEP